MARPPIYMVAISMVNLFVVLFWVRDSIKNLSFLGRLVYGLVTREAARGNVRLRLKSDAV